VQLVAPTDKEALAQKRFTDYCARCVNKLTDAALALWKDLSERAVTVASRSISHRNGLCIRSILAGHALATDDATVYRAAKQRA
jgi:hypothetical protein